MSWSSYLFLIKADFDGFVTGFDYRDGRDLNDFRVLYFHIETSIITERLLKQLKSFTKQGFECLVTTQKFHSTELRLLQYSECKSRFASSETAFLGKPAVRICCI